MEPGIKPRSVGIFSPSKIFTLGLITMSVPIPLPATPADPSLLWKSGSRADGLSMGDCTFLGVRPNLPYVRKKDLSSNPVSCAKERLKQWQQTSSLFSFTSTDTENPSRRAREANSALSYWSSTRCFPDLIFFFSLCQGVF